VLTWYVSLSFAEMRLNPLMNFSNLSFLSLSASLLSSWILAFTFSNSSFLVLNSMYLFLNSEIVVIFASFPKFLSFSSALAFYILRDSLWFSNYSITFKGISSITSILEILVIVLLTANLLFFSTTTSSSFSSSD